MKLEASGAFLDGCGMTDFVQSENNVAERFLNFPKFSKTALADPM